MKLVTRMVLGFAAAGLVPLPVLAADYDPPVVVEEAPEYVPVEVGSGWYLRGDVGYVFERKAGTVRYRLFDATPPGSYSDAAFDSADFSTKAAFSAGFGYHFNDWLRSDVTVEGFRADFNGTTSSADPCDAGLPGTTSCRSEDSSSFSAIGAMVNGYVDLGTYAGFTPYVGAGLGYSLVRWKDLQNTTYCVGVDCPSAAPVATTSHPGQKDWRFTYALMAGVAYDISRNLKLDVGYKYRHIDGGDMFGWDNATALAGATGIQGRDGGFGTHEVKVGLRYDLW